MKVGSIVVVKPFIAHPFHAPFIKWEPVKDEKTPYMIREIGKGGDGTPAAVFEEGIIGYLPGNIEIALYCNVLIELLPPEDIAEQVEDMICVPLKDSL